MNGLGAFLFIIVFISWTWPKALGRWLREVREGYDNPKKPKADKE